MTLLGDALLIWLLVIIAEWGLRVAGWKTDITGLGAIVAIVVASIGAIQQFDAVLLVANIGMFLVWGAIIPDGEDDPDDEDLDVTPTGNSAPTDEQSTGGTEANTGETVVFDTNNYSSGTEVFTGSDSDDKSTKAYER